MQSIFPLVVPLLLLLLVVWTTTTTVTGFSVASISTRRTCTTRSSSSTSTSTSTSSSTARSKFLPVLRVLLNDADESVDASESIAKSTSTSTESESTSAELKSLGWKPHFQSQLIQKTKESIENQSNITYIPARITQILSHKLVVRGTAGLIKTITRSSTTRDVDVAVGDWVLLDQQYPDRILVVLERVSLLQRLAPGRMSRKIQLLAANLDTVFVVSSCNQDFNAARLERYIAMVLNNDVDEGQSQAAHAQIIPIQPVIVLTKRDLWDDIDIDIDEDDNDDDMDDDDDDFDGAAALDMYVKQAESIAITDTITTKQKKIPVVVLDARYDEPLQQLAEWCQPGQTVAFVGSSGVGKSTLVNSLMGKKIAETGDIHLDSGQGRHTTTTRQLHFIEHNDNDYGIGTGTRNENTTGNTTGIGCAILDSPGLRELQLVDASHGVDQVFGDLVQLATQCRFRDCKHDGEPGCAIISALDAGEIDDERVARWEKLVEEDECNSKGMKEAKKQKEAKQVWQKKNKPKGKKKPRKIKYSMMDE